MAERPRLIGINHVALEVEDLEAAIDFYGSVFSFEIRGRAPGIAFLDMGDQFLALSEGRAQPGDDGRHFGLVVDHIDLVRERLEAVGAEVLPSRGLDFRDPSGNHVQVASTRRSSSPRPSACSRAWARTIWGRIRRRCRSCARRG